MTTPSYKQAFVDFMLEADVLRFGSFVTKSGRETPYFINTGLYRTGSQIKRLGGFYADAILDRLGTGFDVLFGPAYKGIPLAVATASALAERGHDVAYCFNRKEAKDHGEGGTMIGHHLGAGDRVLIVEDITTAGTAVRESVPLLRAQADVTLAGLVVSVNRCERGVDQRPALEALADEFSMPTFAIVDVHDIMSLADLDEAQLRSMRDYLERYGA
ncbi:MAG: orotate phosphoribosyltransferase [Acidimicrobiia bacterium]|nr:orotate phosphoribosyltransferase [Acidimicrobiia bacterium]